MTLREDMAKRLGDLDRNDLRRFERPTGTSAGPRVCLDGRDLLCLCSNDYLALAGDPALAAAASEAIGRWGVGAGASRLVSGTTQAHVDLERDLAEFKGAEAALVTCTGWMANHVALAALAEAGDLIVCDKLNHASILDAARNSGARLRTYPHADTARLRRLLQRVRGQYDRCVLVTDSLFSMDGDLAPLAELVAIKQQFDAVLMVDEAHATGVLGPGGRGVAEVTGTEDQIDVTVGTLSKAVGALGGFVAGPSELVEVIRNTGRAYIYTTAPPPAICAAAREGLRIIRDEPQRRRRRLALADRLRERLAKGGVSTAPSASQILPVVVGAAERALAVSARLLEAGFWVPAIRPPTVPPNTSRLRVSLSAGHTEEDVDRFAEALIATLSATEVGT